MNVTALRDVYGTDFLPDMHCNPLLQTVTFCDRCGRRISAVNGSLGAIVIRIALEPTVLHGRCARGHRRYHPRIDRERLRARLMEARTRAAARGRRRARGVA